ncbi:hypothetical protein GCM10023215_12770 [Pseudonocardia yuanmonensis]|uniref:Uncharacterized protein n=1 Tax=Pseudonocardia yuanmonensis TaxID=1095914 RepID=A0ABP8W5L8_9PSEU
MTPHPRPAISLGGYAATVYSRPVTVGADEDAYVQVAGDTDAVVVGFRGVLAALVGRPDVHLAPAAALPRAAGRPGGAARSRRDRGLILAVGTERR